MSPSARGLLGDRVAIVTGAAGGLGRAIIARFRAEGAEVAGIDLRHADAAPGVLSLVADVADAEAAARCVADVNARFGRLDILVNGAATITPAGPIEALAPEAWDAALRANLTSAYAMTRAAIPAMRAAGGGSIVTIASEIGIAGVPGWAAYGATKAALIHFTKVLALDHARDGIRANALSPGPVPTERLLARYGTAEAAEAAIAPGYPMRRLGRPEEIAAAALFLASVESSYMTGANLVVDGGYNAK